MLAQLAMAPDPSIVGAGRIAFFIVALLAVALVLLYLSMQRHIKRIPPTFDSPANAAGAAAPPISADGGPEVS